LKGENIEDLCDDRDLQCAGWAEAGECENNPSYMVKNCKKSCSKCNPNYVFAGPIAWNFDYFLISRTGSVIARWDRNTDLLTPAQTNVVENALKQPTEAGAVPEHQCISPSPT